MPYCPHCGNEVNRLPGAEPVTEAISAEVQIARINADRDIELAKLAARSDRDWNETRVEVAEVEAEAEVAAAEATAEVIGEVLAASAGDETEPGPVVIDAPEIIADEHDDDAPPEVEGSEPPAAAKPKIGLGAW